MLNQGCFSQTWYGLREVMEPLVQSIGGKWKWKGWQQLRGASQVALVVEILPASAGEAGDMGSVPGWGRPGGGHGSPFRYSCLGNPMDRGAWRATVHRVTKSQAQLKQLSTHTHGESGSGKFLPKTEKGCLCSSASCSKEALRVWCQAVWVQITGEFLSCSLFTFPPQESEDYS